MAYESSLIEDKWSELLFSQVVFTDRVFFYDVSEDSAFRVADLFFGDGSTLPTINFFLCTVTRRQEPNQVAAGGSGTRYTYTVRVEYYLQDTDVPGQTYQAHRDRLEQVDDLVRTSLGATWDGTVDYWQGGVPLQASSVVIDERKCWRGGYTYTAFKAI